MSVVATHGDHSDLSSERSVTGLTGEGAGAVETSETLSEDIQVTQTEGAGTVQTYGPGYQDIQSGQMISSQRVAEINAAIVKLQGDLQEGKKVYKEILDSGGSKAQAEKASNAVAGQAISPPNAGVCCG